jgi:hypothetical protein
MPRRHAAAMHVGGRAEASCDEAFVKLIAERDQVAMRSLFARHRVSQYRWLLRWRFKSADGQADLSVYSLSNEAGETPATYLRVLRWTTPGLLDRSLPSRRSATE